MSTRYSMRLRSRGGNNIDNGGAGSTDNDTAPAVAAAASRTALGNISNREGNGDNDNSQQESKKTKRRGRSQAARKADEEETRLPAGRGPHERPAAVRPRRSSSSVRVSSGEGADSGKVVAADDEEKKTATATSKKQVAARKKEMAPRKKAQSAPARKEEAKARKVGGLKKRSSGGGDDLRRVSKRVKKSDSAIVKTATARRAMRSRSRLRGAKSVVEKRKSVGRRHAGVEVVPAPGDGHVVPLDFGLQRDSFDGNNFTYGIAHYDAPDRSEPLRCKDYITDMFQQLYHAETAARPRPYMDRQEDINEKMRAILVDWLVEVHMKFRLVPETLYLCVHILDRYCAAAEVPRSRLQLVGVTALFLACKHEEIYPPEVRDCVYITDRAYDRQEVLDMEQTMLRALDWRVSLPTAYPFLDRFLGLAGASSMTRHAAAYYLERTLQEHDLLEYRPSLVCASAVVLALNNPDIRVYEEDYERELPGLPKILMEYTEFDRDELMTCMAVVANKVCEPSVCASRRHLTAVKKKYEHRKYLSVSSEVELPSVHYVKENMDSE